jgi:hypothetical protein
MWEAAITGRKGPHSSNRDGNTSPFGAPFPSPLQPRLSPEGASSSSTEPPLGEDRGSQDGEGKEGGKKDPREGQAARSVPPPAAGAAAAGTVRLSVPETTADRVVKSSLSVSRNDPSYQSEGGPRGK